MRKLLILFTLSTFFTIVLGNCYRFESDARIKPVTAIPSPTINNSANTEKKSEDTADQNSSDCVRAKPEPIIKKDVFQKTNFELKKNEKFPFEYLGYETVEFENGDKLLIENVGCENFTWVFHFETERFLGKTDDIRFWYKTAAELIEQTMQGIREPNYISDQVKALNKYIEENEKLRFDKEIEVRGEGTKENVRLKKVRKLNNNKVEIVLSFNTGPL